MNTLPLAIALLVLTVCILIYVGNTTFITNENIVVLCMEMQYTPKECKSYLELIKLF